MHPAVIGAVLATIPQQQTEQEKLFALFAVVGFFLALALFFGGIGMILAVLGI